VQRQLVFQVGNIGDILSQLGLVAFVAAEELRRTGDVMLVCLDVFLRFSLQLLVAQTK